ncbi:MAG: hypothetical protein RMK19_01555 [Bacteroidia bacterium]|nr:hypothetical protein [Bacteroidia bacterium]MDW8014681.1 hypothetical protein [Bacteroidia bacterium]
MKWRLLLRLWQSWLLTKAMQAEPTRYRLRWDTPPRYTYIVEIEATPAKGRYTDFALPAWRPGRYIIQNYAAAVSHFTAYDEQGQPLSWFKVTKDLWRVQNPSRGSLRVSYRFHARQIDAGSSYLSESLVYFNPINLLMYLPDRIESPCELQLPTLPKDWEIATALPRTPNGHFFAKSYHELADSPFLSAPTLRSEKMTCMGATIHVHFCGRMGASDLSGFLQDLCKIIQTQTHIWGSLPLSEYHFIYLLVPFQIRHAVEHEFSAMFVLPEEGASSEESLRSFLGISAHEFFHIWNVKRLRPAALLPYRYEREAYTSLHWLTEGITDYYASVTLVRAGLMSPSEYWKRLSAELTQIENTIAYQLFSPSEMSIDSWLATSPYRPAIYEGSFYAAGKRIGFLLDMILRRETQGKVSLDSLLRYLYQTYYLRGKGIPEDGVEKAAILLAGPVMKEFFRRYVNGRDSPDYESLLKGLPLGVRYRRTPYSGLAQIGIVRTRRETRGLLIEQVLPGSLSDNAGIEAGDLLLTIGPHKANELPSDFWERLSDGEAILLSVNRDGSAADIIIPYQRRLLSQKTEIEIFPTQKDFHP